MTRVASLEVDILGVGLVGPGFTDWAAGRILLRAPQAWRAAPTAVVAPARLPANERRRAGAIVRLALAVADQACAQAGLDVRTMATVFSASSGDTQNCHALCEALATPERVVSPTRFTNSVHNAAAGYWHIATGSRAASTSLSGYDASFGAGLLEAASQCVGGAHPVLLVSADTPYPEPLNTLRPLPEQFGVAFVLAPPGPASMLTGTGTGSGSGTGTGTGTGTATATAMTGPSAIVARLRITMAPAVSDVLATPGLESLRRAIPAARSLPLLDAIARGREGAVVIDYLHDLALCIDVLPGRGS